jgi:hypothetical protein
MARRRKSTKKRSHRRRVSGIGGSMLGNLAGVAAGAIAATYLKKFIPVENAKIKAAVQIAAGVLTPKFIKGTMGSSIGAGMVAAGALSLGAEFGIAGVGEDSLLLPVNVGQTDDMSVIAGSDYAMAGSDELSVIAGLDESEEEY